MKKLLATIIAIIAVLAMTVPVMADTVDTEVTIGTSGGGDPESMPYVIAKFETPDEPDPISPDDGDVEIFPEVPNPDMGFSAPLYDGWKQINYYVVVDDVQADADITGVDIIVRYPGGAEKYNLHVTRVRGMGPYEDAFGPYCWSVSGGPGEEFYPTDPLPTETSAPTPEVRELRYQPAETWTEDNDNDGKLDGVVDGDADGDTDNIPAGTDKAVPEFLTIYGSRVAYGNDPLDGQFAKEDVVALLTESEGDEPYENTGKAIMLEIISYIWCHQDPVVYTVEAKAIAGEFSLPLVNEFEFVPQASLYLDFDEIDWGTVTPPESPNPGKFANRDGDRKLSTEYYPTIWNNGNFAGQVSVSATKMLWNDDPASANVSGKFLDTFDVNMDYIVNNVTIQDGKIIVIAGQPAKLITEWNTTNPVVLAPCTPTQIDFSLWIPVGINPGDYYGEITITIANYAGTFPGGYVGYDVGP